MIRSACIAPAAAALMVAALAGPARADDSVSIDIDNDPGPIGIDECVTQSAEAFTVQGTVTFDNVDDGRTATYRIYYYTGEAVCTRESGIDSCPSSDVDSEGNPCGCVYQTQTLSSNTFSDSTTLAATLGSASSTLCSDAAPASVKFAAEIYYPAENDLTAESFLSESSVAITIDRVRPGRPGAAPRVVGVEGGLKVSGDEVAGAADYEVCVRNIDSSTSPAESSDVTNATLREGFTLCKQSGDTPLSGFRFDGLEDNVNYEVVYAAIDAAGNRGPNSDSAAGQPQAQLDFAEQYTAQLGGQIGEQGGCDASPGRTPAGLAWLMFGLIALAFRRRP